MCSTGWVQDWCVYGAVGGRWVMLGVWYAEPADTQPACDLRWWLDHSMFPDGVYAVTCGWDATEPAAVVDYRRVGPKGMIRDQRDQGPYVCPHCGAVTRWDDDSAACLRLWCSGCRRFADGCSGDGSDHDRPDWLRRSSA